MEAGVLVTPSVKRRLVIISAVLSATYLAVTPTLAVAEPRQDLRLYRVNKDGIEDRFWFTRGRAKKAGCHNISRRSRVHRVVQFGYSVCRVYTQKHCAADSALTFTRDDDDTPVTELTQGYSWFTVRTHTRGERIKSWECTSVAATDKNKETE